ncbi:uncharacterized protein LOC135819297 isoform X2 [Sycon ciliatum]|uniref:uncharacterized protein LOC135819297 isoform X2 n=1 Tax=Sycon ciliatum TaxID=27933 RepID=UPI0031F61928
METTSFVFLWLTLVCWDTVSSMSVLARQPDDTPCAAVPTGRCRFHVDQVLRRTDSPSMQTMQCQLPIGDNVPGTLSSLQVFSLADVNETRQPLCSPDPPSTGHTSLQNGGTLAVACKTGIASVQYGVEIVATGRMLREAEGSNQTGDDSQPRDRLGTGQNRLSSFIADRSTSVTNPVAPVIKTWSVMPSMNPVTSPDSSPQWDIFVLAMPTLLSNGRRHWLEHFLTRAKHVLDGNGGDPQSVRSPVNRFSMQLPTVDPDGLPLISLSPWHSFAASWQRLDWENVTETENFTTDPDAVVGHVERMSGNCDISSLRLVILLADEFGSTNTSLYELGTRLETCDGVLRPTQIILVSSFPTAVDGFGFTSALQTYQNCSSKSSCETMASSNDVTTQLLASPLANLAMLLDGSVWNAELLLHHVGKRTLRRGLLNYIENDIRSRATHSECKEPSRNSLEPEIRNSTTEQIANDTSAGVPTRTMRPDSGIGTLPLFVSSPPSPTTSDNMSTVSQEQSPGTTVAVLIVSVICAAVAIGLTINGLLLSRIRTTKRNSKKTELNEQNTTHAVNETGVDSRSVYSTNTTQVRKLSESWTPRLSSADQECQDQYAVDDITPSPSGARRILSSKKLVLTDEPIENDRPTQNYNPILSAQDPAWRSKVGTREDASVHRDMCFSASPVLMGKSNHSPNRNGPAPTNEGMTGQTLMSSRGNIVNYIAMEANSESQNCNDSHSTTSVVTPIRSELVPRALSTQQASTTTQPDANRNDLVEVTVDSPVSQLSQCIRATYREVDYLFASNTPVFVDAMEMSRMKHDENFVPSYCGNRARLQRRIDVSDEAGGWLSLTMPTNKSIFPFVRKRLSPVVDVRYLDSTRCSPLRLTHSIYGIHGLDPSDFDNSQVVAIKLNMEDECWSLIERLLAKSLSEDGYRVETQVMQSGTYTIAAFPLHVNLETLHIPIYKNGDMFQQRRRGAAGSSRGAGNAQGGRANHSDSNGNNPANGAGGGGGNDGRECMGTSKECVDGEGKGSSDDKGNGNQQGGSAGETGNGGVENRGSAGGGDDAQDGDEGGVGGGNGGGGDRGGGDRGGGDHGGGGGGDDGDGGGGPNGIAPTEMPWPRPAVYSIYLRRERPGPRHVQLACCLTIMDNAHPEERNELLHRQRRTMNHLGFNPLETIRRLGHVTADQNIRVNFQTSRATPGIELEGFEATVINAQELESTQLAMDLPYYGATFFIGNEPADGEMCCFGSAVVLQDVGGRPAPGFNLLRFQLPTTVRSLDEPVIHRIARNGEDEDRTYFICLDSRTYQLLEDVTRRVDMCALIPPHLQNQGPNIGLQNHQSPGLHRPPRAGQSTEAHHSAEAIHPPRGSPSTAAHQSAEAIHPPRSSQPLAVDTSMSPAGHSSLESQRSQSPREDTSPRLHHSLSDTHQQAQATPILEPQHSEPLMADQSPRLQHPPSDTYQLPQIPPPSTAETGVSAHYPPSTDGISLQLETRDGLAATATATASAAPLLAAAAFTAPTAAAAAAAAATAAAAAFTTPTAAAAAFTTPTAAAAAYVASPSFSLESSSNSIPLHNSASGGHDEAVLGFSKSAAVAVSPESSLIMTPEMEAARSLRFDSLPRNTGPPPFLSSRSRTPSQGSVDEPPRQPNGDASMRRQSTRSTPPTLDTCLPEEPEPTAGIATL